MTRWLFADLKRAFRTTEAQTFIFPATGPAMWEASLVSALSPGDRVLSVRLDEVAARHHRLAEGARRAIRAWGLALCARDSAAYSGTVSAVVVPEGTDARRVIDIAFRRYNLSLGGGLARLGGAVFRIGHVGDLNELMLLGALAGVEMSLNDAGIAVPPGNGLSAAEEWFRETAAPLPAV